MVNVHKLKSVVLTLIAWCLMVQPTAHAGLFGGDNPFSSDGPLDVERAFVFNFSQPDANTLRLSWTIPEGYYLYRDRIEPTAGEEIRIVERIDADAEPKDDPLFGKVFVYHDLAQVDLVLGSRGEIPVDSSVSVTYQGCWEGGICYPPVTRRVEVSAIAPYVAASPALPVSVPAESKVAPTAVTQPAPALVSEQDRFAGMLSGDSLLFTLGAFFVAGLALSLTPCVFPMIPILSSIIAGQGRHINTRKALSLSVIYVLAVSVTYTAAGVLAGLFGQNLQAAFQNPWIISAFAAVFVALSLSMFGFYDLQLPNRWQSKLNAMSNGQKGGTVAGVAIMGLLSALIVGPCMAAPLAGALIYIGETGDPLLGGMALFSLSLGMGVPLILIGVSAGRLLPKAGVWMESVKAGFGVMLLLLAVWMLDRIVSTEVTMLLTAAILIGSAIFMHALDRLPEHSGNWLRLWKGVGVIVLIYGASLLIGALSGNRSMIYPLQGIAVAGGEVRAATSLNFQKVTSMAQLEPLLATAQRNGQPVMLDFYADWCISCIELETFTFADAGVQRALGGFMLIKVDVTANDDDSRVLNKAYGVVGPPALIFYDRSGRKHPELTLIGVSEPTEFVAHIARLEP